MYVINQIYVSLRMRRKLRSPYSLFFFIYFGLIVSYIGWRCHALISSCYFVRSTKYFSYWKHVSFACCVVPVLTSSYFLWTFSPTPIPLSLSLHRRKGSRPYVFKIYNLIVSRWSSKNKMKTQSNTRLSFNSFWNYIITTVFTNHKQRIFNRDSLMFWFSLLYDEL